MCMYVYVCVACMCMYVSVFMYVCMYACMYVCILDSACLIYLSVSEVY